MEPKPKDTSDTAETIDEKIERLVASINTLVAELLLNEPAKITDDRQEMRSRSPFFRRVTTVQSRALTRHHAITPNSLGETGELLSLEETTTSSRVFGFAGKSDTVVRIGSDTYTGSASGGVYGYSIIMPLGAVFEASRELIDESTFVENMPDPVAREKRLDTGGNLDDRRTQAAMLEHAELLLRHLKQLSTSPTQPLTDATH